MKLSMAIACGRTMLIPLEGVELIVKDDGKMYGCALGMARLAAPEQNFNRLCPFYVSLPCACSQFKHSFQLLDIVVHLFDRHYMKNHDWTLDQLIDRHYMKNHDWTLDQLIDWVAANEPPEPPLPLQPPDPPEPEQILTAPEMVEVAQ
jgi:hypothetical protein